MLKWFQLGGKIIVKKKSRRRRKRTGKVLRLIAGIMGAITFGMEVYMLDVDASGQNKGFYHTG